MFDGVYPSADSAISGLVTLLATAQALGRVKEEFKGSDRRLMFMFFNGVRVQISLCMLLLHCGGAIRCWVE